MKKNHEIAPIVPTAYQQFVALWKAIRTHPPFIRRCILHSPFDFFPVAYPHAMLHSFHRFFVQYLRLTVASVLQCAHILARCVICIRHCLIDARQQCCLQYEFFALQYSNHQCLPFTGSILRHQFSSPALPAFDP